MRTMVCRKVAMGGILRSRPGERRRHLHRGSARRAGPLPLVLRPAPLGLTNASLAHRYDTVHGHDGLTPMRSTCTETTRPSAILTRACEVSWTSAYPGP